MSYMCEICGKGKQFGHNVSFSQRKTNRVWLPNLQVKRLEVDGKVKRVKICTQCLRTLKKHEADAQASESAPKTTAKKPTATAKTTK